MLNTTLEVLMCVLLVSQFAVVYFVMSWWHSQKASNHDF